MLRSAWRLFMLLSYAVVVAGCAHTAIVTDRSETQMSLTGLRLEGHPFIKVLLGGTVREIPLSGIRMIKIDASESVMYDREMYYSAQVVLSDGTVLSKAGEADAMENQCYLCIRNTLIGNRGNEIYRIPLEQVQAVKYKK